MRQYTRRVDRNRDPESRYHPIAISRDSEWGLIRLKDDRFQLVRFVGTKTVERHNTFYDLGEIREAAWDHLKKLG